MNYLAECSDRAKQLLPVYLFTTGMTDHQEERGRPNGASYHQILVVRGGSGIYRSQGQTIFLRPGMAVFTRKGVPSYYRGGEGGLMTGWVTFDGAAAQGILDYLHAGDTVVLEHDRVRAAVEEICREAKAGASSARLSQAVYSLVVLFFSCADEKKQSLTQTARQYMRMHLEENLSVEQIAAAVGVSPSCLYRVFRKEEHSTPLSALKKLRMTKAKELLLGETKWKVEQIARAVGISDPAYFCRCFREETGMTPLRYRSSYR